jgi:hypothetical protein
MSLTISYSIIKEASDEEVDNFFDKEWKTIKHWSEGEGRGQSFYEILEVENQFLLKVEHYGFEDFNEPIYSFVTIDLN